MCTRSPSFKETSSDFLRVHAGGMAVCGGSFRVKGLHFAMFNNSVIDAKAVHHVCPAWLTLVHDVLTTAEVSMAKKQALPLSATTHS